MSATNVSPELLWLLLKKNNSFVIRRNGKSFTSEPGNLRNEHNFKHSGLAQANVVDITATEDENGHLGIELSIKSKKGNRVGKPARQYNRRVLTGNFRKVAKTIATETEGNGYRPDLKADALARWTKINRSQGIRKKTLGN